MKTKKYLIFTVVALVLFGTFYRPQTQNDAFGNPYQTVTVRAKGKSGSWDRDPIRVFLRMGPDPKRQITRLGTRLEAYKTMERSTLRGLQGVQVFVTGPKTEIRKYGLTTNLIRRDVELRLRQAGIKTLSSDDPLTAPDLALFRVWVAIDKHPSADLFLVNVHAELDQLVLLQRDLETSCTATTWKTPAKAGLIARKDLQDVRREVKDHVNRFISDYLVVNQSNLQKCEEHRRKGKLAWSGQDSPGDL